MLEKHYSTTELKELLSCSRTTLFRWIKVMDFPKGKRVGGRLLFRESAVLDWLDGRPDGPFEGPETNRFGDDNK